MPVYRSQCEIKRRRLDAHLLIGLKKVDLSTARKVIECLPDLARDYDPRFLRYDIARAMVEDVKDVLHTVDLELDDGTTYKWHLGRPQGVLQMLASESDVLKRVLHNTPCSSPEKPWDILHYHDEVGAGHLLAQMHNRSFTAFRFSFMQLGQHLLTCDEMWFEFAVLRSVVVNKVKGGMSRIIALLMHLFFDSSNAGFA